MFRMHKRYCRKARFQTDRTTPSDWLSSSLRRSIAFFRQILFSRFQGSTKLSFWIFYTGFERIAARGEFLWIRILVLSTLKKEKGENRLFSGSGCGEFTAKLASWMPQNVSDSDDFDLDPGPFSLFFSKQILWAEKGLFTTIHIVCETYIIVHRQDASLQTYM